MYMNDFSATVSPAYVDDAGVTPCEKQKYRQGVVI